MNNTINWHGYEIQPEYLIASGLTLATMVTSILYRRCISTSVATQPRMIIEINGKGKENTHISERKVNHPNPLHNEDKINDLSTKVDVLVEIQQEALKGQEERNVTLENQIFGLSQRQDELSKKLTEVCNIIQEILDNQKMDANA